MLADNPTCSVLLVQSGALGDTVLQLRIAQALRRACPAARISWLGRDSWLPLASRCPSIDETGGLDSLRAHRLFQTDPHTDPDLAAHLGRFDLILNGLSAPDSPLMDRLRRFARQTAFCYDPKPRPGLAQHVWTQWLDQVASQLSATSPDLASDLQKCALSLETQPNVLLTPHPDDHDEAAACLQRANLDPAAAPRRLVLLHPGSGGLHKCYPLDRYLHLCRNLSARDLKPLMLLGPAELDRWEDQLSKIVRHCTPIIDPPLPTLLALAHLCLAYVGNDSGPTHLFAAAGARTLALFGPTDPRIWRPLGPNVTVLQSAEHANNWTDLPADRVAEQVAGQ